MSTWDDVIDAAYEFRQKTANCGSCAWFRGHADADNWYLRSTLHRFVESVDDETNRNMTATQKIDLLRNEAKTTFGNFKTNATPFLSELQRTPWGQVFAMRHYGIPTRLLDFTTSFACAVFFARAEWAKGRDCAVYAVDPHRLNDTSIDTNSEVVLDCEIKETNVPIHSLHPGLVAPPGELPSIAVQPVYTNPRMVVQQSRFILCGDDFRPLDEQFPAAFIELRIEPSMLEEVDRFLALVGMGWSSYFPDTEGLAKQNEQRYLDTIERVRQTRDSMNST